MTITPHCWCASPSMAIDGVMPSMVKTIDGISTVKVYKFQNRWRSKPSTSFLLVDRTSFIGRLKFMMDVYHQPCFDWVLWLSKRYKRREPRVVDVSSQSDEAICCSRVERVDGDLLALAISGTTRRRVSLAPSADGPLAEPATSPATSEPVGGRSL